MRYRRVSRLTEQDVADQVDALIYCHGRDAEDILAASTPTNEEQEAFDKVLTCLKIISSVKEISYMKELDSIRRRQEPGETVEAFVTALHRLVSRCGYGALKDKMVCYRLVVGLQDAKCRQRCKAIQILP